MLRLHHNFIAFKDRGAGFNSTTCEEEQLQRSSTKGETAEVNNRCFRLFAGCAFNKCRTVRMAYSGELSQENFYRIVY